MSQSVGSVDDDWWMFWLGGWLVGEDKLWVVVRIINMSLMILSLARVSYLISPPLGKVSLEIDSDEMYLSPWPLL